MHAFEIGISSDGDHTGHSVILYTCIIQRLVLCCPACMHVLGLVAILMPQSHVL